MAPSGKLYTCPNYFRSYRIEIAAEYAGYALTKVFMEPGKTAELPEFKAASPSGAVPALMSSDGVALFEASAIATLVGGAALSGGDCPVARAQVSQWCAWADQAVLPATITWVMPCLGVSQFNKSATDKAREEIRKALAALDQHLDSRTWLVGERVTQADITVACNLLLLYSHVLDPSTRAAYGNVNRWFVTFVNQPQVAKVLGAVKLAEKMAQFDAKKYAELHPKAGGAAAKKPAKKEEKKEVKKEAPAPAPEEDAPPAEKKEKDPFAKLPSGTLVLDEFKREFSNKTPEESQKFFWEHFDPSCYSIWYCEYLFPEELRMLFMSANLVSGMYQRLDGLRKHAFGVVGIFGEHKKSTISGVWVWRGQDLAFTQQDDLQVDYESYSWKKLDVAAETTKALVNDYWFLPDSQQEINGQKISELKVYK